MSVPNHRADRQTEGTKDSLPGWWVGCGRRSLCEGKVKGATGAQPVSRFLSRQGVLLWRETSRCLNVSRPRGDFGAESYPQVAVPRAAPRAGPARKQPPHPGWRGPGLGGGAASETPCAVPDTTVKPVQGARWPPGAGDGCVHTTLRRQVCDGIMSTDMYVL